VNICRQMFMVGDYLFFLFELCSQLNLKSKKPIFSSHFLEKTPEYSGVFSGIFVTNIGFSNNQNHQIKFRFFDKLFPAKSEKPKDMYFRKY